MQCAADVCIYVAVLFDYYCIHIRYTKVVRTGYRRAKDPITPCVRLGSNGYLVLRGEGVKDVDDN